MIGSRQFVDFIGRNSLLDLLPEMRQILVEEGTLSYFDPGDVVAPEGSRLFLLMIPVTGNLRLVRRDPGNADREEFLGYLNRGRALGLGSLLASEALPYSAVVEESVTVVSMPVVRFLEFLEQRPTVKRYLQVMTVSPGARSFKEFLRDQDVAWPDVVRLVSEMTEEQVDAGASLLGAAPRLVAIDEGTVTVRFDDGRSKQLGPGAWFGGRAFTSPHRYDYTAVAGEGVRVRVAPLTQLSSALAALQITEQLFDEPWLVRDVRANPAPRGAAPQQPRDLPGVRVGASDVPGFTLDPTRLHGVADEAHAAAATVCNIALLLGVGVNEVAVRNELAIKGRLTILALGECLEAWGFETSPIRTDLEGLRKGTLPCIIPFGGRVVVLLAARRDAVFLADPLRGFVAVEGKAFSEHWDGQALEVVVSEADLIPGAVKEAGDSGAPSPEKREKAEDRAVRMALIRVILQFRRVLASRFALGVLALLFAAITPKMTQYLIDEVFALRDPTSIATIIAGVACLAALGIVTSLASARLGSEYAISLNYSISNLFYRHFLRLPVSAHDRNRVGELRADLGELSRLKDFYSQQASQIGMQGIQAVLFSILLLGYDFTFALLALSVFPLIFVIRTSIAPRMKAAYEEVYEISKVGESVIAEQVASMTTIKATGSGNAMREKWEHNLVKGANLRRRIAMERSAVDFVVGTCTSMIAVLVLFYAVKKAMDGTISIGSVLSVNSYATMLMGPAAAIAGFLVELDELKISQRKVAKKLAVECESAKGPILRHTATFSGKVRLEQVSFRYGDEKPWVLHNLSVVIYPRQTIAIVGRSGCGKSTLARLLAGELRATNGRIFFDSFDEAYLTTDCRRRQVGFIMQDNALFSGAISENIAYTDPAFELGAVAEAAHRANAKGFIENLPGAYDYFLAEGGAGVSGGQRQRISIARTLYRDPTILILDEATSALDAESEGEVLENMNDLVAEKTVIIIAHRLSTIRRADRILVMRDGQIVEDGTHMELLRRQGYYFELFKDQVSHGGAA